MTLANQKSRTALAIQKVDSPSTWICQHHVRLGPFPTSPSTWIHGIHFKERSVLTSPWTWTCGVHVKERSVLTNSPTWTREIHVREGSAPHKTEHPCEERTSDPLLGSLSTCVTLKSPALTVHIPGHPCEDRTSAWLPDSLSTRTTSKSPVPTAPVPVSFVPPVYSVTSPLCPLPPQTSATLITNTQATSQEKPVDTPIVPG